MKNALIERVKSVESACKSFVEKMKTFATEKVMREEIQQPLEGEETLMTQTVGQSKRVNWEKEEAMQEYIQFLEASQLMEVSQEARLIEFILGKCPQ